jgi:uncharacterized protein
LAGGRLRTVEMAVFLVFALSLYGLVNFYIARRGWQALAAFPAGRGVFLVVFILLVLAYPLGRIVLARGGADAAGPFIKLGSLHMAFMLYLFMGVVLVDLVRLANAFLSFLPRTLGGHPERTGPILFALVLGAAVLTVAGGAVNAARPRITELDLRIEKPAVGRKSLTVVMASDLHLGTLIGPSRLAGIVDRINALGPDIVLLPGDIVDESVTDEQEARMSSVMRRLNAPLGVYAVPGNHEFYSGLERNLACLRACGIRILEDEAVVVDGSIVLVGRRDPSALGYQEQRVPIREILRRYEVDENLPLILLDHQPLRLREAEEAGIDLQLSGHTHAGQLFPLNLINKRVWELNQGYLRKGSTQYYVTPGVGTWGPPVRTGSRPEIVRIALAVGTEK